MFNISNLFRKKDSRGATMIELIAVLAIMGLGVTALLSTIGSGIDFARDTENNIKAINLAREGIEGMINIRDTNWLRFSSDKINCWNTYNYSSTCIGGGGSSIINSGTYLIYSQNGVWNLTGAVGDYTGNWNAYKSTFKTGFDNEGFYTQTGIVVGTGCTSSITTNCNTIFTREIQISYPGNSTGAMSVTSIVRWKGKISYYSTKDGGSASTYRDRSVILNTILTNWKSKF